MGGQRRSLQERIRERQQNGFIGRQGQLVQYRENFGLSVDDERRQFLFNIHGDAGVGKTFLTRQLQQIAVKAGALTAYIDETADDPTAAMTAIAAEPLRAHRDAQKAERESAGATWHEWDLVWCQPNGQPIDTHDDWDEWKALLAEAGIRDVRLHDARHTAGTLLGELHVDMHVIQRILGHAQVSTTRIYTDPTDPLTREAADRIGGLLLPD